MNSYKYFNVEEARAMYGIKDSFEISETVHERRSEREDKTLTALSLCVCWESQWLGHDEL